MKCLIQCSVDDFFYIGALCGLVVKHDDVSQSSSNQLDE